MHDMSAGCAWIEGSYVPVAEARIPILDTGFVRSDLTYDVVGVWGGRFFRLDDHLDRFERGCERLRLRSPRSRAETEEILTAVVARSGLREAYVETIVTRGVPTPGERDPRRFEQRFYAYAIPYVWIQQPEQQEAGAKVVVARDTVRVSPGAIDPTVKNFMWGDFIRGLLEAYDRDAVLPILSDGDGNVTEGPGVNVFVVRGGVMHTPGRGVLEGITRLTVLDIAAELGIPAQVEPVPLSTLYDADEVFLTSTAGGVMPVAELDGQPVGDGAVGDMTRRVRQTYWDWHEDPRFTRSIDYGD
jgi:branched-chain amino acid aminotransferase